MAYIFDLETDGLYHQATKIHTIAIYDLDKKKMYSFNKHEVIKGIKMLHKQVVIGHNIVKFDLPVIQKFYPWFTWKKAIDTLILATFAYPDIGRTIDDNLIEKKKLPRALRGKYSLEAFGYRLGELKGTFAKTTDWQEWSPAMQKYCIQDVKVTLKLWQKLSTKAYSKQAVDLEHKVAWIIGRLERYGWYFDVKAAWELEAELRQEFNETLKKLREVFPPKKIITGFYTRPNKTRGIKPGDPKIKIQEFNPGSSKQIIARLREKYGKIPISYTKKGNETIADEDLKSMGIPEADLLLEYKQLKKWLGMLADGDAAWLKVYDSKTNRIYYSILTNGAVTGRMRHISPNIAQVPKMDRFRRLFTVPEDKILVGVDASGLEFRCFANRVGDPDYIKVVLEKDIHTENQKLAGLETRSQAKTFIYAFLYGGGDEKLGRITHPDETSKTKLITYGKQLREKFLQNIPGLNKLYNLASEQAERYGYVQGLDGRKIIVDATYKAVNRLLQSDGAIVMKKALVILDTNLQKAGLKPGKDYEFVGIIHDEFQIETKPEYANQIGTMASEAIREAARRFNFVCPLDGDMKIGRTWAETH